jgi:hypothetical protein
VGFVDAVDGARVDIYRNQRLDNAVAHRDDDRRDDNGKRAPCGRCANVENGVVELSVGTGRPGSMRTRPLPASAR